MKQKLVSWTWKYWPARNMVMPVGATMLPDATGFSFLARSGQVKTIRYGSLSYWWHCHSGE
jgi:hypothetical protein